jgi:hypothetical protein
MGKIRCLAVGTPAAPSTCSCRLPSSQPSSETTRLLRGSPTIFDCAFYSSASTTLTSVTILGPPLTDRRKRERTFVGVNGDQIRRRHCPFDYARRAESAILLLVDPELARLTIQSQSTWSSTGVPAHRSRQSNDRSLVGSKWPPHRGAVLRTASPLRAPPLSLPARARPLGSVVREVDSIRVS